MNTIQNNTPYALRKAACIVFLGIGIVLLDLPLRSNTLWLASLIGVKTSFSSQDVLARINKSRAEANLPELKENETLTHAALAKAEDMLNRQYFAHNTPDGKTPWTFLDKERYTYQAAGENLALDFQDADTEHAALMASPSHRANILNSAYTEVGVAVEQGTFQEKNTILVVQFFALPIVVASEIALTNKQIPTPRLTAAPASLPAAVATPTPVPAKSPTPLPIQHTINPRVLALKSTTKLLPDLSPTPKEKLILPEFFTVNYPLAEESAMRIGSGVVLAFILFPLVILSMRRNPISTGVMVRAILLLLLFGYILGWRQPRLPAAKLITARAAIYQQSTSQ